MRSFFLVSFFALFWGPVVAETWIDAREATFVAQFQMTISRTCSPPDSILQAVCTDGVIELVEASHPSIQCVPGDSKSEMNCSIICGGQCDEVFIENSTASVSFNCAVEEGATLAAIVVLSDEREGACEMDLFNGSKARKVAKLGLVCNSVSGSEGIFFGHKTFECGPDNYAEYLSHGEYECVEEIHCGGSACDLLLPPITITSNVDEDELTYDCIKPTSILLEDKSKDSSFTEQDNSETALKLFSATYRASWSLYKLSSTNCERSDTSSVEITCQSAGTVADFQVEGGIDCSRQSENLVSCTGDAPIGDGVVTFSCAGDIPEKALSSLHYNEAYYSCDSTAHHVVQMEALCDGEYKYQDYYWECARGEITIDWFGRITCYESLPSCQANTDCEGVISPVTMEADPNVAVCMSIVPLSDQPSSVPSKGPLLIPSSYPSQLPSDLPSLVPTTVPSSSPSQLPSDLPSLVPTTFPTGPTPLPSTSPTFVSTPHPTRTQSPSLSSSSSMPSDYPSIHPPKWIESATNLPTGHRLDDDYVPPTLDSSVPTVFLTLSSSLSPSLSSSSSMPSDYPSIHPPKWIESATNLPTGHRLDDDYIPPASEPDEHFEETEDDSSSSPLYMNGSNETTAPTTTTTRLQDLNHSLRMEGISAPGEPELDEKTNIMRTFTYVLLLVVGMTIAIPAVGFWRRGG